MKFIDEVKISVIAGDGGAGASSFRREKYIPFGGPDGGNGGRGGHIYFRANENFNTLANFRGRKVYQAPNGKCGQGRQCDGETGKDLIVDVPIGTLIKNAETLELLFDLTEHGQTVMVAQGGRGGLGNLYFKSSTNQAPRHSQPGGPGEDMKLVLELKLLADIGLVGFPNAGKSTLISCISEAKPKIADYPFTTLDPQLGVVKIGERSFVVADIPGLIEHAAEGKGLGIQFLKHIERTKSLVHLVDCSMTLEPFEAYENYIIIRQELEKYNPILLEKKEIVCLTKIDAMSEEEITRFQEFFEAELGRKVLPISAVAGKNLSQLIGLMQKSLESDNK